MAGRVIPAKPDRVDGEAQVVIIGAGACGLTAALRARAAGADVLVAGSSVFKADDPRDAISRLKACGRESILV